MYNVQNDKVFAGIIFLYTRDAPALSVGIELVMVLLCDYIFVF